MQRPRVPRCKIGNGFCVLDHLRFSNLTSFFRAMISRQFQLFFFITQPNNHAQADGFTMWPF